MAKNKKSEEKKDTFQNVESALTRAERFIESKQKIIIYSVVGVLLIVLGIIAYNRFIKNPRIQDAWTYSYKAEEYFAIDSFNLALNGDGINPGFIAIIDEYGSTPMGNVAKYNAGVCYIRLGQFEDALKVLKSFKSDDPVLGPQALALIADANVELNNLEDALKNYLKAADKSKNEFSTPMFLMKAGYVCELLKDYKQALDIYTRIDKEYYGTSQQRDIEKYIQRVKNKM